MVDHLSLVKAIAIRVHENLPVLDDLVHADVLGLMDAVEKSDASKNVAFQVYAKLRIKGAILADYSSANVVTATLGDGATEGV